MYKILGCLLVLLSVGMMFANTSYATVPVGWKEVNDDIITADVYKSESFFTYNIDHVRAVFNKASDRNKKVYQCSLIIKDKRSGELCCGSKLMGSNDKHCTITVSANTNWDASTLESVAFYRPIYSPFNSN
jgi:hypothetical protein